MRNEIVIEQQTEWHEEVDAILTPLDECEIQCEWMTWIISHLLDDANVKHSCMQGFVKHKSLNQVVVPHHWILLEDGWVIDFRLRMWLGDNEEIPHGLFHLDNEPLINYQGNSFKKGMLNEPNNSCSEFLDDITEGKFSRIKVPPASFDGEINQERFSYQLNGSANQ